MMFELFQSYFPIVTPIIVAFGVAYINSRSKIRELKFQEEIKQRDSKRDEEFDKILKAERAAVMSKLNDHDLTFTEFEKNQHEMKDELKKMNEMLEVHMKKDDNKNVFDEELKTGTIGESELLIQNRTELDISRKTMVTKWGKLMHDFASIYHKSPKRKEKKLRRTEFLLEQKDLIISEFNNFTNQEAGCVKIFKGKTCRFSDFMDENRIYASFELLIRDLINNNIDDVSYIEKFQIQINTFCKALIVAQGLWEGIKCITPKETAA